MLSALAVLLAWAAAAPVPAAEEPAPEQPDLPQCLQSVAGALAQGLPQDTKAVLLVRQDAPELDRYAIELLGVALRGQNVQVAGAVASRIETPADGPPAQLPGADVPGLLRAGASVAVAAWIIPHNGTFDLLAASYGTGDGRALASVRRGSRLTGDLAFLCDVRPQEMPASDREWLELLERLFPPCRAGDTPAQAWAIGEGLYFFRRGFWPQAAQRLGALDGGAPDGCALRCAFALQEAGEGKRAVERVEEALKLKPDSGPLYALKAWLLRADSPDDALIFLEQARLSDVAHEGFYWIARYLMATEQGKQEIAEQALLKGPELLPNEPFAQLKAARYYWKTARMAEAVKYYRRATEVGADTVDVWLEFSMALEASGQAEEALTALRRAFEMNPANPAVAQHLAAALKAQGRYDEALATLGKAAAAQPDRPEMLAALGDEAASLWRLPEAEEAYRQAVALDAQCIAARIGLARVEARRRRFEEAEKLLRDVLASHPDCRPAQTELARAFEGLGRAEDAAALLEEVARSPVSEVRARIELARLRGDQRDFEAAVHNAQVAVAAGPSADGYAALARAFTGAKDWENAAQAVRSGQDAFPTSAALWMASAGLLEAQEQYERALEAARKAVERDPHLPEALVLAGRLCLRLDQADQCVEFWGRAAELDRWNATLQWDLAEVYRTRLQDYAHAALHYTRHVEMGGAQVDEAAEILRQLKDLAPPAGVRGP